MLRVAERFRESLGCVQPVSRRKTMTREELRLQEARDRTAHWRRWGPYLAERQWGTVREDYSPYGTAWEFFPPAPAGSGRYGGGEAGSPGSTATTGPLSPRWPRGT